MRRFFLFTYSDTSNFEKTKSVKIFGSKEKKGGIRTKLLKLKKGDVIVLRKQSKILEILGFCVVVEPMFEIHGREIFDSKNFLWDDEKKINEVIYKYRVKIRMIGDFEHISSLTWDDLLALQWRNEKGNVLNKHGWVMLFTGNLVHEPTKVEQLNTLFKVNNKIESQEASFEESGFLSESADGKSFLGVVSDEQAKKIGNAGERFIFDLLNKEYSENGFVVEWTSVENEMSPYDLVVKKNGEVIYYVEVKSTVKSSFPEAFISENELQFRKENKDKHRIYLVVYDGSIEQQPSFYTILEHSDFFCSPIKYKMKIKINPEKKMYCK